MFYTQLTVKCLPDFSEILMAELSEAGFDTFLENEEGFQAYVEGEGYDREKLNSITDQYTEPAALQLTFEKIEKRNWNEEWEKSYEPINVEDQCLIRAEFHTPERKFPYEIIITPKMSFGTGHHQTTYLMIKTQLTLDHEGRRVMDAGCGTAILSIMASKRGATEVYAFDIDEWSAINGGENLILNDCANVHIQRGKITEVDLNGKFDIVLANINKNILLEEMHHYERFLLSGGKLLLSGFYEHDIPDLLAHAETLNLKEVSRDSRESWACLLLEKVSNL